MLLESVIKDITGLSGNVFVCKDVAQRSLVFDEAKESVDFFASNADVLHCISYNEISAVYYSVVASIMYYHFDIDYKDIIVGSHTLEPNDELYLLVKEYIVNEDNRKHISENRKQQNFDKIITNIAKDCGSYWDAVCEYVERNEENLDVYDVVDKLSPMLKDKIKADLINRNLLKDEVKSKNLFGG